jgi:hypothetical protein
MGQEGDGVALGGVAADYWLFFVALGWFILWVVSIRFLVFDDGLDIILGDFRNLLGYLRFLVGKIRPFFLRRFTGGFNHHLLLWPHLLPHLIDFIQNNHLKRSTKASACLHRQIRLDRTLPSGLFLLTALIHQLGDLPTMWRQPLLFPLSEHCWLPGKLPPAHELIERDHLLPQDLGRVCLDDLQSLQDAA